MTGERWSNQKPGRQYVNRQAIAVATTIRKSLVIGDLFAVERLIDCLV